MSNKGHPKDDLCYFNMINLFREKLKRYIIENKRLQTNLMLALPFWIGAFLVGVVSVIYARLFEWAENGGKFLFENAPNGFFVIAPVCFAISWILVVVFAPYARGSGIPQVLSGIEMCNTTHQSVINKLLSIRVVYIKILSSLVMVFGGGVIGREGPTIQIAASIFRYINQKLPEWYPKISETTMIVTGAASGLASAFNTPLGGIVFAIEELSKTHLRQFRSALFTGVIISGLTALAILGPYLYLGVPVVTNYPYKIVFYVVVVVILTSLASATMCKIIIWIFSWKVHMRHWSFHLAYAMLAGLIMVIFAYWLEPKSLGSGKELMIEILFKEEKYPEWYLVPVRILGSIFSFTAGASGGIFAPSLSTGACIGAYLSGALGLSAESTNLLALCGMVAFLTTVTRGPFTTVILVYEMTLGHHVIFYLLLSALIANLIGRLISRKSLYEHLKLRISSELKNSESN